MLTGKMLIFFTLVAAPSFAYPEVSSLWNHRVFPDDVNWSQPRVKHERKHSEVKANDPEHYNVCKTKECKIISEEFLSSMNKSIDPCNDFYDFVCGAWTPDMIPPSFPAWSRFMIFQNTVHHRIKGCNVTEILETEIEPSDLLPVRQAKKWYRSCMDTDALEYRGMKPIESILMRAGGWPIAMDEEEWDSEGNTWQSVERHYARLTGEYTFYRIQAFSNDEEAGILVLDAPPLPLSEQLTLKYRNYSGNDYNEYVRLVSKVADFFVQDSHAKVPKKILMKEAKEIVELEKEIYELDMSSYMSEEMTLEEFYDWYETNVTADDTDPDAQIDWKLLLPELFDPINIKLDPSTNVYLGASLEYLQGLGKLLAKKPRRTIVNYIHWKFVGNMLTYTTEAMRDLLFQLVREEYGVKERPSRWYECVNNMEMAHAASYVFVNKYFTNHTKSAADEMIKNIQLGMEEHIENSNWLDAESKTWAKDKLNNMKVFLGFPDWYKNKTAIMNYYKGLTIGTEYFDNALSYMRYKKRMDLKRYADKESDHPGWQIDPITVNALYVPSKNYLNIPAVDLQAPLFTPKLPDNINYGIAGVIVGHEMGHGFDDTGINFGKAPNASTLSETVLKSYYQRADCFLDQFDEYYGETEEAESGGTTERSESLQWKKSLMTRGENIADTTGIQSVFEAYHKLKNRETISLRLPGFEEFTDDQMFFISFSATWCEIGTPEYEEKKKESGDEHSPAKFRVLGSVSNTKDFAKVFNCPAGSPMNPINKCNIWRKPSVTPKTKVSAQKRSHGRWHGQWNS